MIKVIASFIIIVVALLTGHEEAAVFYGLGFIVRG